MNQVPTKMEEITMKKQFNLKVYLISFCFLLLIFSLSFAQKIETIDGVRVVHNGKSGKWGENPKLSLEFVKTIGELETEDENLAFHMPSDIIIDSKGYIYILDSGNHRIQKFDSDGKYITTIGNKGQGPGEFYYPLSIDINPKGYLYVSDPYNQRAQVLTPDGKEHKTILFHKTPAGVIKLSKSGNMIMGSGSGVLSFGLGGMSENQGQPGLIKVAGPEGEILKDFGQPYNYKNVPLNRMGNQFHFTIDNNDNIFVSFDFQNRVEKYSSDGKLLWKSDRKLNYDTDPAKAKPGKERRSGGSISIESPQINRCSNGIAVDKKGRVWVITLKRQIKEEESVQTSVRAMRTAGGDRSLNFSYDGNTDVTETDMYQLEVYAPDGILLGKLPLNQFVDDIRIEKDRLFLLDKMRGAQYYEYKITEK